MISYGICLSVLTTSFSVIVSRSIHVVANGILSFFLWLSSIPSEKAMAPHSSTLTWKIPWMEEPGGMQSMARYVSDTTEQLHFHFSLSCIGEGNGNPLQCSCLENPRDGGAYWAAIYGVAQRRTRLKRLSSSSSSSIPLCIYHIFFIHAPVDGHLGCFHAVAITNSSQVLL